MNRGRIRCYGRENGSEWRLLETGCSSAFYNMALDEAIMEARMEDRAPPTLRLYGWKPRAVSIGYFQRLREEVDIGKCKELGIDVVRRMTGGGAVFHDKEVTYSVIASETDGSIPQGIQESYELICAGIVEGLGRVGVQAALSTSNDIVVGAEKISGNAQKRRRGVILQHGTVLLDADYETMFGVLKNGKEELKKRNTCMPRERMTSLRELNADDYDFEAVSRQLVRGFETVLGVRFSRKRPTKKECARAETLIRSKYSSQEWIELR
ncbi:MAG: biotin/lipoate A/B protein ligase family protein [Thermoplasmata archaeon]